MKRLLAFLIFIMTCSSFAQSGEAPPTGTPAPVAPRSDSTDPGIAPADPTEAEIVEATKDLPTQSLRGTSQYSLNAHLSPLSTWLPMKYGFSLGYIQSLDWTFEAELTRKTISAKLLSVDFGEIVDQRYGLQARWYPNSNSFNWILGIHKSYFSFELGNTYLSNIPGSPSATVWKFESIGPQLGVSNRWQWSSGVTFGVDWFVLYVPAFNKTKDDTVINSVTNPQDKEELEKAIKAIQNIPQFDLFRLGLGYTF